MSDVEKPFDFSTPVIHSVSLTALAGEIAAGEAFRNSGRAAVTVARENRMTTVLTVLAEGAEVHEHGAPAPVTLVVVSGEVLLRSNQPGAEEIRLSAGGAAVFAGEVRHSLTGLEDSVFLIVIGGRTSP